MKVSKDKLAENRAAMLGAAGRLFRSRGIDGVGVAEICKTAGLTHGALYAQFGSKDGLAREALADGLQASNERMNQRGDGHADPLSAYLDYYLSTQHRDDIAGGCSIAALGADVARQDQAVSEEFAAGVSECVETIATWLTRVPPDERRARALAITSLISGAITASRAILAADAELADRILVSARTAAAHLSL
jgi:TetR/AcrR family transcriptional regulator, transcriptional repressor for nem operon